MHRGQAVAFTGSKGLGTEPIRWQRPPTGRLGKAQRGLACMNDHLGLLEPSPVEVTTVCTGMRMIRYRVPGQDLMQDHAGDPQG